MRSSETKQGKNRESQSKLNLHPQNFLRGTDITVFEGNKERPLDDLLYISVEVGRISDQVEIIFARYRDDQACRRIHEAGRIRLKAISHALRKFHECWRDCHHGQRRFLARVGDERGGKLPATERRHYCAAGYRGEKRGVRGGSIEVMGNAGYYTAEYLSGGEVRIHGNAGDLAGVELRGGTLIIGGSCSRPCGNMTVGTCMVF